MGAKVRKAEGIPRGRGLLGGEGYVFWKKKDLYVQIRFLVKRARGRAEKKGILWGEGVSGLWNQGV